jgi:hypothetical protein
MKSFKFVFSAICLIALSHAPAFAGGDFGIVMDVNGKAEANKKALDLGRNVMVGDTISVSAKGHIVIVEYKGCFEWKITGPAEVKVSDTSPEIAKGSAGKVEKGRKMPACYKPNDVKTASTHEQGALVLMTKEESNEMPSGPTPDAELSATSESEPEGITQMRKDFKAGKTDVPSLISLIMHDLKKNDKDSARVYYAELKKKAPASAFVKQLEKDLN